MSMPEKPKIPQDEKIEKLLQLAGPRLGIDSDVKAAVKSAARDEWRKAVESQRRRRWWRRGAGALLATAALWFIAFGTGLWQSPENSRPLTMGSLVASVGEVVHFRLDEAEDEGLENLLVGESIETGIPGEGEPSRAYLELLDGTSIRLDSGSRLRLVSTGVLSLERGTVYVATTEYSRDSSSSVEIRTPMGVARDIGTRFEVRFRPDEKNLRIRVRDGEVVLRRDDQDYRALGGEELSIENDGMVVESPIEVFGDSWDWILEIHRGFDAEGRSLHEFLIWATEEAGWELRYAENHLLTLAKESKVSGSTEGMAIRQAIDDYLLASGLSSRMKDGVLWVEEKNSGS